MRARSAGSPSSWLVKGGGSAAAAAAAPSGSALLAFIARPAEDRFFDPMYALRLCSQHGRSLACVHLYSAMGLWEEAVDLALTGEGRKGREWRGEENGMERRER